MWNRPILGDLEEDPQVPQVVPLDEDPITDKDQIKVTRNKWKLLGHFLLQKPYVKTIIIQDMEMIIPMIIMTIMVTMITDLPQLVIIGLLPIMETRHPFILLPVEQVPLPVVVEASLPVC